MPQESLLTKLNCKCGNVTLELSGEPIICAECHCKSCNHAAQIIQKLSTSSQFLADNGGTPYILYRKDRVRCLSGEKYLKEFFLTETSSTRRVIASCCYTPIFLEFKNGHWLSLYSSLWPQNEIPAMEVRTMISDLADTSPLSNDLPNAKTQSLSFMMKLLSAWIKMGFRTSKAPVAAGGRLDILA